MSNFNPPKTALIPDPLSVSIRRKAIGFERNKLAKARDPKKEKIENGRRGTPWTFNLGQPLCIPHPRSFLLKQRKTGRDRDRDPKKEQQINRQKGRKS